MFIFICVCACVGAIACHMYVPDYRSQKGCWSPRRLWVLGTQFKWFSKSRKLLHIEPCVPSLQPFDKPVYLIFNAFGISNKEHVHGWALGMTGYYLHLIYGIVFEIPLDCPSNCAKCARFQSNTCLYIIWGHQVKQMCHLLKSQGVWHPGTSCQSGNPFISTSWHRDPFLLLPPWDAAWLTKHLPSAAMARFLPCGITLSSEHSHLTLWMECGVGRKIGTVWRETSRFGFILDKAALRSCVAWLRAMSVWDFLGHRSSASCSCPARAGSRTSLRKYLYKSCPGWSDHLSSKVLFLRATLGDDVGLRGWLHSGFPWHHHPTFSASKPRVWGEQEACVCSHFSWPPESRSCAHPTPRHRACSVSASFLLSTHMLTWVLLGTGAIA